MFRLLGFLAGVCVTLAGAYWLLGSSEPQDRVAGPLQLVTASAGPGAESLEITEPGPHDPGYGGRQESTTGSGEALIPHPAPPAEPASASPVFGGEPLDGDSEAGSSVPREIDMALEPEDRVQGSPAASEAAVPEPAVGTQPVDGAAGVPVAAKVPREPAADEPAAAGRLRFVFWSPFRSERAARGFADRLTLATAVQVNVVRLAADRYRVAFDYQDEAERLATLSRIEQITGLDLSGGGLP